MSLSATLHSYFTIIKKVQTTSYPTKSELIKHVEKALEIYQEKDDKAEKGTSGRTLDRNKKDIYNLFGIDIQYSQKHRGYYIAESGIKDRFLQQIAESFDTLQMLHLGQHLQAFIQPEKHPAKGTEHFSEILNAIKNKRQLTFTYHKFWDEEASSRIVEPYLLKEAINRWYLIALDTGNKYVKHFALDRMSDITISDTSFTPPANKSYEDIYKYCFGIDGPHNNEEEPQEIILSFNYYQGKYIKTLPLHHSQKILIDTAAELRISLHLYITRDLEMQLLSYGEKVKVLQPQLLSERIAAELKTTLNQYKK